MPDKQPNSRNYSATDRVITEVSRLLAVGAPKPQAFSADPSRRANVLRASHTNATAALGLRRGLQYAARSREAKRNADSAHEDAVDVSSSLERELRASGASAGIAAAPAYCAGLALGLCTRVFGDESGRRLSGSVDQLFLQSQAKRAAQLDETDPELARTYRQRQQARRCSCGPHGHTTRSRLATRLMTQSARLFERLYRQ